MSVATPMAEVPGCFGTAAECEAGCAHICKYVSKLQEHCCMAFVDPELRHQVGDRDGAIAGLSVTFALLAIALIVVWAWNCRLAASRKATARQ